MPPALSGYDWAGGREAMLRFGPPRDAGILIAPPLLEEANRTRAALVDVARRLAALGHHVALPDLPGQGESLLPTARATLADWRRAFAAAAAAIGPVHVMAWRGGALLDADMAPLSRWHLSPLTGDALLRDLHRVRSLGDGASFAGNRLNDTLLAGLVGAVPAAAAPVRTVRLAGDPRPADLTIAAPPLWRAAEPATDADLQAAVARDMADWIARCAG